MNVMTFKNIRFRFNHTVALQTLNLSKQDHKDRKDKSELFFNKKSIKINKSLLQKFPPLILYVGILLEHILYSIEANQQPWGVFYLMSVKRNAYYLTLKSSKQC